MPNKPKARKGKTTAAKAAPAPAPTTVEAVLSPLTEKRLDGIAFKQVRIETRTEQLAKQIGAIELTVGRMAQMLDAQLSRILTPSNGNGGGGPETVFHRRAFKKVSIKLRKRFIECLVEDCDNRRRLFRCSDWTALTYLIANQTLREGIEEVPVGARKVQQKSRTLARAAEAPVRTGGGRKRFTGEDASAAQEQARLNRSREKAEKAIRGLRDESYKDKKLEDALGANGFLPQVAFDAADNCGRITEAFRKKFNSNK